MPKQPMNREPNRNEYYQYEDYGNEYEDEYSTYNESEPTYQQQVYQSFVDAPKFSEAITLPRFDVARSNEDDYSEVTLPPKHSAKTTNEMYVTAPDAFEAITIPRAPKPVHPKYGKSNPFPPVPMQGPPIQYHQQIPTNQPGFIPQQVHTDYNKAPAPRMPPAPMQTNNMYTAPLKEHNSTDRLITNTLQRYKKNARTSMMILVDKNKKNCMYGCIPIKKKPRLICMSVTLASIILTVVMLFLFLPR
jgi:hypothetical protein